MSQYSGSGKFVKILNGNLSAGINNTTYYEVHSSSLTIAGTAYHGITLSADYLKLQNVSELCISDVRGFTGSIRVYTNLYYPFDPLIWDPSWWSTWLNGRSIWLTYETWRFVNGILVSVT